MRPKHERTTPINRTSSLWPSRSWQWLYAALWSSFEVEWQLSLTSPCDDLLKQAQHKERKHVNSEEFQRKNGRRMHGQHPWYYHRAPKKKNTWLGGSSSTLLVDSASFVHAFSIFSAFPQSTSKCARQFVGNPKSRLQFWRRRSLAHQKRYKKVISDRD